MPPQRHSEIRPGRSSVQQSHCLALVEMEFREREKVPGRFLILVFQRLGIQVDQPLLGTYDHRYSEGTEHDDIQLTASINLDLQCVYLLYSLAFPSGDRAVGARNLILASREAKETIDAGSHPAGCRFYGSRWATNSLAKDNSTVYGSCDARRKGLQK